MFKKFQEKPNEATKMGEEMREQRKNVFSFSLFFFQQKNSKYKYEKTGVGIY